MAGVGGLVMLEGDIAVCCCEVDGDRTGELFLKHLSWYKISMKM